MNLGSDPFTDALVSPPEPTETIRKLMREECELWDDTVREPIPEEWLEMLRGLK